MTVLRQQLNEQELAVRQSLASKDVKMEDEEGSIQSHYQATTSEDTAD
jgi:hypothetical protein